MPNEAGMWNSVNTKEDHLGVCKRVSGVVAFLIQHHGKDDDGDDREAMVDVSEWDAAQIASFILGDRVLRKIEVKGKTFNVVLKKEGDKEGGYSVRCIEYPEAISQGETAPETLQNIAEAIELVLEAEEEGEDAIGNSA